MRWATHSSDMREETRRSIESDQAHCWHPFTRQAEWCARSHEPLVLVRGEGSWLWDSEGRRYLDGNSSIWTNIHGHAHPSINAAIHDQLGKVAHTSFLGSMPQSKYSAHRALRFAILYRPDCRLELPSLCGPDSLHHGFGQI